MENTESATASATLAAMAATEAMKIQWAMSDLLQVALQLSSSTASATAAAMSATTVPKRALQSLNQVVSLKDIARDL